MSQRDLYTTLEAVMREKICLLYCSGRIDESLSALLRWRNFDGDELTAKYGFEYAARIHMPYMTALTDTSDLAELVSSRRHLLTDLEEGCIWCMWTDADNRRMNSRYSG
jgi:hypothetical protein